jgi:copper chaperone CopZ
MRIVAVAVGTILLAAWAVSSEAAEIILAVPGIPGPYCAYGLEKRLLELQGVQEVKTLWPREQIRIVTDGQARLTVDDVKRAVKRADYPYKIEIRFGP